MSQFHLPRTASRPDTRSLHSSQEEADARDFAEFIAGQNPIDAAAASWLVRGQDGLTAEEEAELQEWLASDPAHAKALEQLEEVWGHMDELPDESVQALKAGLPPREAATPPPRAIAAPVPPVPSFPKAGKAARPPVPASPGRRSWLIGLGRFVPQATMAAVAFSVGGGGWYGWRAWQRSPTFEQAFSTVRGERKEVKLPDDSTLWLDTSTRIDVALFHQRREVRLSEGQVLFAVQHNPGQPFDVLAGNTRITVVGTRFSVRHTRSGLSGDGSVNVVVEEGRVRVASLSADTPREAQALETGGYVELAAGQSVTATAAGTLGPVSSESPAPASWREGRVNFNGTPLAQALAEFERYGATGLVIRDPAVAALKVHGSFDLQHVGAFVRALPQVLPVQVRPMGEQTEIAAAPSAR
ncbi:MAG: FecR domain-containing protein [Ottowia sp.]|uniref:FecR family protein n=1 Tax=Ottowia sp. TaxID=1898956 RepID=UPI003C740C1C